ncbi:MAG: type II CRISPR RNA-guided endonuclease Cas9 [Blautia wexlerae]
MSLLLFELAVQIRRGTTICIFIIIYGRRNVKWKKKSKKIYLGLDIGTDSVGYAVTDDQYNLLRVHGDDAWGSVIFDAASLSDERRSHRSARRRLDRRQQRINLLQEIFAKEISKVDDRFFIRLSESYRWREDVL